jgi:hypothetical protein
MSTADPIPAELRRKNLVLGLTLGGLSLALMVAFIIIFTRAGLPKDPKEWQRQQDAHAAGAAAPIPADGAAKEPAR